MKRIATTIVVVLLLAPWTRAESGCADCGAIVAPTLHCVPTCTKATAEVIEWGVVSDPVCVTHCRFLSCLPFRKSGCDSCDEFCDGGCDSSQRCRVRGRNRLMRKTLVEYIPVTDYVVAPICQSCLYQRLETEPVPAPDGSPVLAPLIDAAADTKSNHPNPGPVHWINSDTDPTGASTVSDQAGKSFGRLDLASPLRALTAPTSSRNPASIVPGQR